jgi:signal transduction histidine kinase
VRLLDLLRSRIALRIYLVGVLQVAIVGAGFLAFVRLNRPTRPSDADERELVGEIAAALDDPARLREVLERAREELSTAATVTDPDGKVIVSSAPPDAPPCAPPHRPPHRMRPPPGAPRQPPGPICRTAAIRFPDGDFGRIELLRLRPPPPPSPFDWPIVAFVLAVIGVSSWLLARSLVGPLRRLSGAARAFGGGDLGARARVDRKDELGEVARAFDEMAERVRDLLQAEKELVANVSHELRTPLARIRVALDLAAEGDAEVARASLADIAGDLEELERLVGDVLTVAKLELGSGDAPRGIPPLRRETVAVPALIDAAVARFRALHPDRPLEVAATDDVCVDGDPVLLRRVVDNLLDNADKYSKEASDPVELRARREAGQVVVEVADRGIGIAKDDLRNVFVPFFRADRSRTRATGGLGLGLALAKRVVEAHGGGIELTSEVDRGTTVRVRLPLSR